MNNILLHIPHSGTKMPKMFWNRIILSKEAVLDFQHKMEDTKTNKLFHVKDCKKIVFPYARIFCDVEKFVDDKKEIMSKFGMGVIYQKNLNQQKFINVDEKYKQFVLNNFYFKYHAKLDKLSTKLVKEKKTILVDGHSFNKDIIMFSEKKESLPDICVGYNENANQKLVKFTTVFFKKQGLVVKENYPYEGSMISNCFLEKPNKNFFSIMIEINKNNYLQDKKSFSKMHKIIKEYVDQLKKINL